MQYHQTSSKFALPMFIQTRSLKLQKLAQSPTYQRGATSLVFVFLVSLVVMATTTEAFKTVQKSQEVGTAINAISHAESATLTAAEAFRLYLEDADPSTIRFLSSSIALEMEPIYGSMTVENIAVLETSPNVFQIDATFINKHAAARSSAKLQVVYNVSTAAANSTPLGWPSSATVNFSGDLNINGGINLENNGNAVDLVVDGDIDIGGVSVNPINALRTSGTVTIGSRVTVNSIFADDDVNLANTQSSLVRTMGDFRATGDASISVVQANGNIEIQASGRFDELSTLQNITITSGGGSQGYLLAGQNINAASTRSIDSASAVGDIIIGNWFRVNSAISMGDINCPSRYWQLTGSLSANGSLINCPTNSGSLQANSGASNVVTPPATITPVSLNTPSIDVWSLRDEANYFVEYDASNSRIKVTVKYVNGFIDDTEYTLATFSGSGTPYRDYLCSDVNQAGHCNSPSTPTLPLCFGQSLYNDCISYNTGTNTFTINPNQTVPGVMFIDGNISLGNGHSITTILASGNITTNGQFQHWAANRGGYEKICEAEASHAKGGVQRRYTEAYSTHFPTNLCDTTNSTYLPTRTGNIGLAAGGINPDLGVNPDGLYTGGDIDLGASTNIVGAVLAGNILGTTGQVVIQGAVSAGAFGDENSGSNSLGGSTTIDFNEIGDFKPLDLPDMAPPEPVGPSITTASVLWSRPL